MISIILVRHAERKDLACVPDPDQPLTISGAKQAKKNTRRLFTLHAPPSFILTSSWKHARQTACIIADEARLAPSRMRSTAALRPRARTKGHWADDNLYSELRELIGNGHHTIALVGHEPRLSQLILRFTKERRRQLEGVEAACVEAEDWQSLCLGLGKVAWRYPVRNWLEDELAGKITSKMMVATFLASANFIGLMELLIGQRQLLRPNHDPASNAIGFFEPWWLFFEPGFVPYWIAVIAQFAAAGLFIATVYAYDRLMMPSGFWLLKHPWGRNRESDGKQENLLLHGHLREHMIRVWVCFFTPAVICSVIGVISLLIATGVTLVAVPSILICCLLVRLYRRNTPTGDVD